MYDVIFFTDQTDNIFGTVTIGAFKCAHVLRKHGYSCLVVNHYSEYTHQDLNELIESAVSDRTMLVGFSSTFLKNNQFEKQSGQPTPPYAEIVDDSVFPQGKDFENKFVESLRKKNNKLKIIVGGTRVTQQFSNRNIDYAFIGYSEISIVNLANHLTQGESLNKSNKNIYGVVVIDDRFAPAYNFNNEDMVWESTDVVNHHSLPIEIGRGCIFKCKFCSYPMNGKQNLDFVKTVDLLESELRNNYHTHGIRHYHIVDDTFNDHIEKLESIRSVVDRLDFQPIFWGYHRLDLLCTRPDTVKILHDIGVRSMYFGIETLNEKTGRIVGKGFSRSRQIEMIQHIRVQYPDISMHGSFILGLPEESLDSMWETHVSLTSQDIPLHSWISHGLHMYNTNQSTYVSEFEKNFAEYGYIDTGTDKESKSRNWKNSFTNNLEVSSLAKTFNDESRQLPIFMLPGHDALALSTYGGDFDILRNTPYHQIDFYDIEHTVKPNFDKEYKKQLLNLVQQTK
jgi:Radical SAM superfamily